LPEEYQDWLSKVVTSVPPSTIPLKCAHCTDPLQPRSAILPLLGLVTRYPPDPSYLTPIHPIFLEVRPTPTCAAPAPSPHLTSPAQHCVSARAFSTALPVLLHPITEIDLALCPDLHYNDNLVYHYAGGVALAALKRFADAEEAFTVCVGSPAQVPAALQMDAYKKLVLVQLILHGKVRLLPLPLPVLLVGY
jgi:COP9 signalosome complex subunit 3